MKDGYIRTKDFPSVQAAKRASEYELGYYREMKARKRAIQQKEERLRERALARLSAEEREALGF